MYFEPVELRKALVKLNIDDIPVPYKENISGLLEFPIDTYAKLHRGSEIEISWDKTFKLINQFLGETSVEDQIKIAMFLITAHDSIIKFFSNDDLVGLTALTQELGIRLDKLDQDLDLMTRLEKYVELYVPIGDFSKAGTRDQDTASLTFHEHEAKKLLSLVLLNKLLTPLFGTFIKYCQKRLDTQLKEVHCVTILTPLIKRRLFDLIVKLQNYIKHAINSKWKESPTSVFHSHTLDSLSEIISATIIIKDFVNVDLFFQNGNLLKYINVTAKHGIMTNRTTEKNPIYPRLPMAATDGDDGNIAQLEIDSATSIKTFDTITIVKSAISQAITNVLSEQELDLDVFNECIEFYRQNLITPSTINQMVAVSYLSTAIGGGKGISFLNASGYTEVITCIQMVLFKLGYQELAHLLTAKLGEPKMIPSDLDNRIKVTANTSDEFRNCKSKYDKSPTRADTTAWTNKINKVVYEITGTKHHYNTCDKLWELWDSDNLNGKVMICSENVIPALCSFIELS